MQFECGAVRPGSKIFEYPDGAVGKVRSSKLSLRFAFCVEHYVLVIPQTGVNHDRSDKDRFRL